MRLVKGFLAYILIGLFIGTAVWAVAAVLFR